MNRFLPATAIAAFAIVQPALAAAPAPAQDTAIEIRNFMFMTVTVTAGSKVTWINRDEVPHTVREKNRLFASAALDTGDSFSYTFTTPGTYEYFCSLHPQMVAKVIVTPAAKGRK